MVHSAGRPVDCSNGVPTAVGGFYFVADHVVVAAAAHVVVI